VTGKTPKATAGSRRSRAFRRGTVGPRAGPARPMGHSPVRTAIQQNRACFDSGGPHPCWFSCAVPG
jgi:hypothetical protein